MKFSRVAFLIIGIVLIGSIAGSARSILEKKFYFSTAGKVQDAKFWRVFVGNYDMTLKRKVPGEGEQTVKASMNLTLLSSGYIEAVGYADRIGRVTAIGYFAQGAIGSGTKLEVDSVDYICCYGEKAKRLNGDVASLLVDVEGTQVSPRFLKLTTWTLTTANGDDALREPKDYTIDGFSFTKEGAQKAMAATAAMPSTEPAAAPAASPAGGK
jgi:hypothetical protein